MASPVDLFASRGSPLRFHRLRLLFTGGFGSLDLLFLSWERGVAGRTCTLAVFGGIWEEKTWVGSCARWTCWVNGFFRCVKNKRTHSILILPTFGLLAQRLQLIDKVVLKEKQHNDQHLNGGNNPSWPLGSHLLTDSCWSASENIELILLLKSN